MSVVYFQNVCYSIECTCIQILPLCDDMEAFLISFDKGDHHHAFNDRMDR